MLMVNIVTRQLLLLEPTLQKKYELKTHGEEN